MFLVENICLLHLDYFLISDSFFCVFREIIHEIAQTLHLCHDFVAGTGFNRIVGIQEIKTNTILLQVEEDYHLFLHMKHHSLH